MVVKCSNCETLLRIDEDRLPKDKQINIRCPKCGAEGMVGAFQNRLESKTGPSEQSRRPESQILDNPESQKADQTAIKPTKSEKAGELTIPEDAFKSFRFPAEISSSSRKKLFKKGRASLIAFVIASIIVVVIFAALVNIILPGLPPASVERITTYPDTQIH
ncbi:MAG: MJ0042-type zinc finger domain-containing protein [Desulfomonilaceae bacterium]